MTTRHARWLVVFAIVVSAEAVQAATRRVPDDVATIQGAINASADGDRVVVGPGVWRENVTFGGKLVTLESAGGAATTIIGPATGTAVTIGPGGALVGFTIANADASFGAGVSVTGTGTLIARNVFDGNIQQIGGAGAAILGNNASPLVEGNVFRRNVCDSQFLSGVVSFINFSSPVIRNNVFEDNPCRAITLVLPQGAAPLVINNTIVRNLTGLYVDRRVPASSHTYRNNIIVGNTSGVEAVFGSDADNPLFQHNLVFGNTTDFVGLAAQTGSNGNLSADPRFRGAVDYRLAAGSPAIDAGSPIGAPPTDFAGATRPTDGNGDGTAAFDIGAFEADVLVDTRDVVIAPPAGVYVTTQRVDLTVIVPDFAAVVGGAVTLDGQDITGPFLACSVAGRIAPSGLTLRCPGLALSRLGAGSWTIGVRIDYADGRVVRRSVAWEVRATIEP